MEQVTSKEAQSDKNWSEKVEDLVAAGDISAAISLLETVVSKLDAVNSPSETVDLQLASALTELSKLYSSNHFCLKSDELLSRAALLKQRALHSRPCAGANCVKKDCDSKSSSSASCIHLSPQASSKNGNLDFEEPFKQPDDSSSCNGSSDDDWEAMADRAPSELLSSQGLPSVSNISLEDTKVQVPKRRGRGTFLYKQDKLYSDRKSDASFSGDTEDEELSKSRQQNTESAHYKYGTRHILVLADFPPSMRTADLENLVKNFTDHEVVIRWVSDTVALAVFETPSIALEAQNHIKFPFTVRILDEDDVILGSISLKDLEPLRRRPQTSARTAQRMIAQGMGFKLPSTTAFGSRELKNQEEARKNRIVTRQKMIEDAWGDDASSS